MAEAPRLICDNWPGSRLPRFQGGEEKCAPGYALGLGSFKAALGSAVVRMFKAGRGQGARDRQQVADAPLLALLGTARDIPYHWLVAGEALAHVLLRAQVSGIAASFLNQPIEVAECGPGCRYSPVGTAFPSCCCASDMAGRSVLRRVAHWQRWLKRSAG